ncbi:MAG TPA: membrane protein FxsA, partial [Firmicutes bacterium]|nr:membrane protein FxsA [Bacillota bacterium]
MVWKLILAFTIIPIIELYLLMKLAGVIGAEFTILI